MCRRRGRYDPQTSNSGRPSALHISAKYTTDTTLDPAIVLILGVANLLADGFSMGMSNYLSQRSEQDYRVAQRTGAADSRPPRYTAAVPFLAFVVAGSASLVPYAFGVDATFRLSIASLPVGTTD